MILFASFVLITGSIFWTAFFRLTNKPAYLIALYLLSTANVTLTEYIANSFLQLNNQGVVLAIHALIAAAGWLVWRSVEKPAILGPFDNLKTEISSLALWLRKRPVIALFAGAMGAIYLFGLAQIIFIPQNSMDGLSTYLSRVGFWLQNGSFFPWETTQFGQVIYPVNAQLQIFWTVLFLRSDHLAGITQWAAVLASGLGVWGISRIFAYSREQSAFASLIYLSFPIVVLQSTTVQTDMITAVFFVIAVYFLLLGFKHDNNLSFILFSISTGLGVGTKKSFFLLLIILFFTAFFLTIIHKRTSLKKLSFLLISTLAGIALFGAYMYAVNWHTFGYPFGVSYIEGVLQNNPSTSQPQRARTTSQPTQTQMGRDNPSTGTSDIAEELLFNIPRILYQFVDVSGLPRPLSGYAHKAKAAIARSFFLKIGFEEIEGDSHTFPGHVFDFSDKNDATEDASWFGPLGFLLLFPTSLLGFIRGIIEKNYIKLIPLFGFIIFLPLEVILRPGWDPYQGRYFAPIVAISTPLLGELFKTRKTGFFSAFIAASAIFLATVSVLYNPAKPTFGKFADELHVWKNERIFVQTIQRKQERPLYMMIEDQVPKDAVLAYLMPGYFLNYPLFGKNFTRTLLPITNNGALQNTDWAKENQVDYLLVAVTDATIIPNQYQVVDDVRNWQLYKFNKQ